MGKSVVVLVLSRHKIRKGILERFGLERTLKIISAVGRGDTLWVRLLRECSGERIRT